MKKLYVPSPEQKESARHGETLFPMQKYITKLDLVYPVVTTHWHEEAELTLITEGEGLYQIDLVDYEVKKGDILFVPPLLLHSVSLAQSQNEEMISETYVFHLNFLGGNSTDICSTRYFVPIMNQYCRALLRQSIQPMYQFEKFFVRLQRFIMKRCQDMSLH